MIVYLRLARGWTFKAREFRSTCRAPKLLDLDPNHIAICVLCGNTWMTIRDGTAICDEDGTPEVSTIGDNQTKIQSNLNHDIESKNRNSDPC